MKIWKSTNFSISPSFVVSSSLSFDMNSSLDFFSLASNSAKRSSRFFSSSSRTALNSRHGELLLMIEAEKQLQSRQKQQLLQQPNNSTTSKSTISLTFTPCCFAADSFSIISLFSTSNAYINMEESVEWLAKQQNTIETKNKHRMQLLRTMDVHELTERSGMDLNNLLKFIHLPLPAFVSLTILEFQCMTFWSPRFYLEERGTTIINQGLLLKHKTNSKPLYLSFQELHAFPPSLLLIVSRDLRRS